MFYTLSASKILARKRSIKLKNYRISLREICKILLISQAKPGTDTSLFLKIPQ